jgi:hypothetical protein
MAYIDPKYVPEDKTSELEKQQNKWKALLLAQKRGMPESSSYRRRSATIQQGGVDATNWESKLRAQRDAAFLKQQAEMNNQRTIGVSTGPGANYANVGSLGASGTFNRFFNVIGEHESSNNYNARNRDSGAMGRFQIMPGNLGGRKSGWDYEALGRDISPGQFMASPQLQDAIARYKLQQYYSKYGPRGAAIAWYAGPGALKYSSSSLNKGQGKYSSINQYANAIMRRLGY